ncbi:class A beta-lactamase-related serine hydrolase [Agromyces fucosus]|uniref:Class A beta-lactamase-related serine hydrolase n=1 Tax=Agromyces fucosus TaxID=41985 RepID=A0A4Q2JR85_9MICO|nr:serine hydrolase domain-containing protein [Agromyces fucosus]RXZ49476.1 class A beta-lactamase-related serine hydrolase [Agromyces fucosus]
MAGQIKVARRRAVIAVFLVGVLGLSGCTGGSVDPMAELDPVGAAFGDDLAGQLQAVLDEAVALSGSSGGVAGAWSPWSGEWTGASGTVDFAEKSEPVTTDTEFRLGTLTSEVTCTVLLRLVDEGRVALDDHVDDYVDWVPGLDGITLGQLCAHTSGVADYYPGLKSHFVANPERIWPPNELLSSGLALPRTGAPGEQWTLSRTGVLLLSMALERRTGRAWNDLAEQYVLDPLGLEDTKLPAPNDTELEDGLGAYSAALAADGTADCAVIRDDSRQSSSMGGAAAGAVSSLDDARRLSAAFATGALLDEGTARKQWTPIPLGGDTPAWQSWGLGGAEFGPMRGLAGESTGALTAAFTDPESGLTVVIALNNSTSGGDFAREAAFALASLASKAAPAPEHEKPLVELPWSFEQATTKMRELAKCPKPDAAAEPAPEAAPAG